MRVGTSPRGRPRACVTVDVERRKGSNSLESVRSDVEKILAVINPICKATFFVTGDVAQNAPEAIRVLVDGGHEVACHGLYHERFDTLSRGEQLDRISTAVNHIEHVTERRPVGFRAPEHRANTDTLLALEQLDFVYDSSVLPGTPFMRPQAYKKWRYLFAPRAPYRPSRTELASRGNSDLIELPCSTFFLPFVSKLTMRSLLASNIVEYLLSHHARSEGLPLIFCMHSYDALFKNGDLSWLRRLTDRLTRDGFVLHSMSELADQYQQIADRNG